MAETEFKTYRMIGAVIVIVLLSIISISAPFILYSLLEKSYGSVIASQLFKLLMCILLFGVIIMFVSSVALNVITNEGLQKEPVVVLIVTSILIILIFSLIQTIPTLRYVGYNIAKIIANATNITMHTQPRGSELGNTLMFVAVILWISATIKLFITNFSKNMQS